MTDPRSGLSEPEPPEAPLGEIIEVGIRRATTALVLAAAIVGLAVYARPAPPRYQAFAAGDQIVRVDTRTGTIIGCERQQRCMLILKRGQVVAPKPRPAALPKPAATPLPAVPAAEK